jgi:hypothetical protein
VAQGAPPLPQAPGVFPGRQIELVSAQQPSQVPGLQMHVPLWVKQAVPSGQVPQSPPHPSGPQSRPAQFGVQHSPRGLHSVAPAGQHSPSQQWVSHRSFGLGPSATGVKTHWPSTQAAVRHGSLPQSGALRQGAPAPNPASQQESALPQSRLLTLPSGMTVRQKSASSNRVKSPPRSAPVKSASNKHASPQVLPPSVARRKRAPCKHASANTEP